MSGTVTTKESRFWIVGLVLIAGNMAYFGYSLVKLHHFPTVPEMVFHVVILIAGLAMLDWDRALGLLAAATKLLAFWKRNGEAK